MQVTWSLVAGGAEIYALTIASNLDADNYKVALCALDQGGALEDEIKRLGIPYFVMNRRPGIEFGLMWRLYQVFRKARVDVVQTHHFNQLFYSALGAKLVGARIIHTEHSVECYKQRRLRVALKMLSLLCHKVIAIGGDSDAVLRQQVGIARRKLVIIRAGVDLAPCDESREQARQALGLDGSDRVVTIVARLFPEKNHRLLLAAFAEVVRQVEGARLLIAGDGTEEGAIRAEIERLGLSDHVRMLGVRRDVARLLAASDVFVLPSDREGLPIAVLEAMSAARPVVATAVGDLPTVVRDGETGRLVPRRDANALATALIEVLGDAREAARLGMNARRLVEEDYSLRSMIDKYDALYVAR